MMIYKSEKNSYPVSTRLLNSSCIFSYLTGDKMVKYKQYKKYTCETCKKEFEEYYFKRFCCNYCRIIYKFGDLVGKKFNRLLVKKLVTSNGSRKWECLCDCGNTTVVDSVSLNKGKTKSCGCYSKEISRYINILPFQQASFNRLFGSYKKSAKEKNLSFNIEKDDFKSLTSQNCFYCGDKPNKISLQFKSVNGHYIYNGLDRVDNTKGYEIDNIVPCCTRCNIMKKAMSQEVFLDHIAKIYNNQQNKILKG